MELKNNNNNGCLVLLVCKLDVYLNVNMLIIEYLSGYSY